MKRNNKKMFGNIVTAPTLLKEWTEAQTAQVKRDVKELMQKLPNVALYRGSERSIKHFRGCTWSAIDSALGLAYTSSGSHAGLWVCNVELAAPFGMWPAFINMGELLEEAGLLGRSPYNIRGFVLDTEGRTLAAIEHIHDERLFYYYPVIE